MLRRCPPRRRDRRHRFNDLASDRHHQARAELAGRGVDVSTVDVQPWGSFVFFADPDGNRWAVQQLPNYARALGGSGDISKGGTG